MEKIKIEFYWHPSGTIFYYQDDNLTNWCKIPHAQFLDVWAEKDNSGKYRLKITIGKGGTVTSSFSLSREEANAYMEEALQSYLQSRTG